MTPYPSGKKDRKGNPYLYYTCTSVAQDGIHSPCTVRTLPARAFEDLVARVLSDLGHDPAILQACIDQANGDGTRVVTDLEERRHVLLSRQVEAQKGIHRIVEYIKTYDEVPSEIDQEMRALDKERHELQRSIEKTDLEIAHRKKKVLDADLMRQQLQHFEQLIKVLPLEDQKELFQLLIKEVRVYPFDPSDITDGNNAHAVVASARGRLYKVEISLHQLPGVGALRSLNGKGSDNGKLGSPDRIRTCNLAVNSRLLYR